MVPPSGGSRLRALRRTVYQSWFPAVAAILLVPSIYPALAAQTYNFHTYTNREGLPQSQVLALQQDHEGYLWFATYGGLGRYDGSSIVAHTTAHGLSSNVVTAMTEDREGRLHLGTIGGGACVMEAGRFRCLSRDDGLPSDEVSDLVVDDTGRIWMATPAGVARFDGTSMALFTSADGLPADEARVVILDREDRIWVGTRLGLAVHEGDGFRPANVAPLADHSVLSLLDTPWGLLVGTSTGLHLLTDGEARELRPPVPAPTTFPGLAWDPSGAAWIASSRGLLRFDGESFLRLDERNGLVHAELLDVLVDREGNVWASSDVGVSKLVPGPFRGFREQEGLPNPFARALAEAADGHLWVGTRYGAAAWSPDEGRFVTTIPGDELPDPRVYALSPAPEGGMLAGTRDGLVHWREGAFRILFERDGLPSNYTLSLLPDGEGGVWVGTDAGVARWRDGAVTPHPAGHPLSGLFAVSLARDARDRLWIGLAAGGIRIWDGERLEVLDRAAGLTDQVVWAIDRDREGAMWVGTNGDGAFRVDDSGIRRFTTAHGLSNDFVWQVLVDSDGATWLYTNQGLDRYRNGAFRHFGEAAGLIALEGTAGAALEDSAGRLWFGTGEGVMEFDPSAEMPSPVPPRVRIQELTLGGHAVEDLEGLRFRADLLQIRFGALTFRDEAGVRFRYRLLRGDRNDEPWSEPGRGRTVGFASLGPGPHTFEVEAISSEGVGAEVPATLSFTVVPAWWQTWWVRLLGVGLVAGLAAAVPVVRSRRVEAERRRLESEVQVRTGELEEANARLRNEIRERKRFEAELRASEIRLRQIVENSTIVFYSHTPDHEITYVSPQIEDLLGVPPDEAPDRWTSLVTDHPINARGMEITRRALETGRRQPPYELELAHASGRLVRVRVTETPVVEDGVAVAIVGSLTDVTEARRAEEERSRLEERLRQAQKMEAVGRLAGGIAHGFNNLLTSILGHAELMEMELDDDHALHGDLLEIRDACDQAASLVAQLLALGRKQMIQPSPRSLNETLRTAEPRLRQVAGSRIALSLEPSDDDPWVHMDRSQLVQVLVQLVRNAREAMPDGGRVTITTGLRQVGEPSIDGDPATSASAVLEIRDDGPGMPPELAERAFEPFFTTKEAAEGAGLGLATVYGIVKQNGGHIRLETTPGRGAAFLIHLPATRERRHARA